jgi:hypothetical protein
LKLSLKRIGRFNARQPRLAVQLTGSLLLSDDREIPIKVKNLSPDGFMGKCSAELSANTWLGVDFPSFGIVRACVRWSEDGEVGCRFRVPIDVDRLCEGGRGDVPG